MAHLRFRAIGSFILGFVSLSGCGGGEGTEGGGGSAAGLTYFTDAKPIVDAKCAKCHVEGGIAPFPLTTYAEVEAHKGSIRAAVESRTMPPWPASNDCNEYLNDRSLSDEQIATLVGWIDEGAAEGDAAKEGEPLVAAHDISLSRVDVEIGMAEPYEMGEEPDDYRCFVLDWPEESRTYVTGLGVRPGNAAVVHHVIAFIAEPERVEEVLALDEAEPGPGYTCFGGPGFNQASWLGGWVPGNNGNDYAQGTGVPIEPGSKIVMQVHYNTATAGPLPDQTIMQLKLDDQVDNEAVVQPWANPGWLNSDMMEIPAHADGVVHEFSQQPTLLTGGEAILIHSAGLHMHQLGQSATLTIERANDGEECLLDIPSWNFHWQGQYPLVEPIRIEPGDKLKVECTWDNPTADTIVWGEGTGDEMCLGTFYYTLAP